MRNNEYILGTKVNVSNFDQILSEIDQAININKKITITYLTPHIANYCYKYPSFHKIFNEFDITYADGIGIVLASRLNGGNLKKRITLADCFDRLCIFLIEKNMSVYLLGGKSFLIDIAVKKLKVKYPALNIAGYRHGYFSVNSDGVIEEINRVKPNVLLVGMGLPYQEEWVIVNKDQLNVNAIWACGGIFDLLGNKIGRAPRWMLKNNLEWLYRLYREPKRLWKRYLIGNPLFLIRVLRSLINHS